MHQNHMSQLLLIHNVIHPNDLNILLLMDVVLSNVDNDKDDEKTAIRNNRRTRIMMTKAITIIMTTYNDDDCKINIHKREDSYGPYAS